MTIAGGIIAIILCVVAGDWLARGKRELFDEPGSDWPDGDRFVIPDEFKTSVHSAVHTEGAQRDDY